MPVQTTEVTLNRTFYTDGAYVPNPPNSLYYTVGMSEPITSGTYKGLYTTAALEESSIPGLYEIPESGRSLRSTDIIDYSVTEDTTTLNPGNLNGGTGQITLQGAGFPSAKEFFTASMRLADSLNGDARGTVRGLNLSVEGTSVTADSLAALFNVTKSLPTQNTNLRTAMGVYLKQVGLSIPLLFEDGLGSLAVKLPAQEGNAWEILKQIASAYQFEIGFVGGSMVLRKPRKTTINLDRSTLLNEDVNSQEVAKKVRVHYYANTYGTRREVYPVPVQPAERKVADSDLTESETTIYTVDASETVSFIVDLQASLTSVNQPKYVDFVEDRSYAGTDGVYTAVGSDDLPVSPSQWVAYGGSLSVRLLDNQRQIEVTIVGPNDPTLAPYRIAMSSGSGNYYNALHITGTGLIITDDFIDLVTGATDLTTTEEIGLEVTNPYIDSKARAYSAGQYAAASQALSYVVSAEGYLFVPGNLTFGKVGGSRVAYGGARFRVDTASTTPISTSFTASLDVIIKDANQHYAGMTMGEVSTLWDNRTFLDISLEPLHENG